MNPSLDGGDFLIVLISTIRIDSYQFSGGITIKFAEVNTLIFHSVCSVLSISLGSGSNLDNEFGIGFLSL